MAKLAGKTHKDRVNEFNAHLESLSEHHDIPKVHRTYLVVFTFSQCYTNRSDLDNSRLPRCRFLACTVRFCTQRKYWTNTQEYLDIPAVLIGEVVVLGLECMVP